jgi:hypothetical protein
VRRTGVASRGRGSLFPAGGDILVRELVTNAPNSKLVELIGQANNDEKQIVLRKLVEQATEPELLEALADASAERAAAFVIEVGWPLLEAGGHIGALENARRKLITWAGADGDKRQFADEVADVLRRVLALQSS